MRTPVASAVYGIGHAEASLILSFDIRAYSHSYSARRAVLVLERSSKCSIMKDSTCIG